MTFKKPTRDMSKSSGKKDLIKQKPKQAEANLVKVVEKAPVPLDTTTRYMMEISKHPLLTPEEELSIAKELYDYGSQDAAQKLVVSNLRFVVKIAGEYKKFGLRLMDVIQEGNLGLLVAVKKFNPYRGIRLTSYAVWWIRSYIHDYMLKQWSLVKIGTTTSQKKLFYRLRQEQEKLRTYLDNEALPRLIEHKVIADNLGVKEKEVADMEIRLQGGDLSLDVQIGDDEGSSKFLDMLFDKAKNPEERIIDKDVQEIFDEHLEGYRQTLNSRDVYILEKRLLSDEPVSLQEIGKKYNVSRERVRQLEERIKNNLKDYILSKQPDFETSK